MINQRSQDQADGVSENKIPLSSEAFSDDDDEAGSVYEGDLQDAGTQVRATEDASLQDDTYAFDEDNTSNEDIHDVSDFGDGESELFDSQDET